MPHLLAAADVGGTFIDIVLADPETGRTRIGKVLHRKGRQGEDIFAALRQLVQEMDRQLSDIASLVIGTTVVTNALLEGQLAKTALFTTEGFRDVIEIARMTRPSSYDLHKRRAPVVAPRNLRFDIPERLDHTGAVLKPLDLEYLERCIEEVRSAGVEAIAVSFLYSYVDSEHEAAARERLTELGVPVSISSEVLPVFREYERTAATALNAASIPVMSRFLDGLGKVNDGGIARTYIMGSAGGCLTFSEAARFPIKCAMSGPAGGVVGTRDLARQHGFESVLTLDVGGTSSDLAVLHNAEITVTDERVIGGYPVAIASAEIETIGAGGGSIAHMDATGLLKVGPRSSGSDPGPVSYGRGGTQPTVTDAHVALNRLGERSMLGGEFRLDRPAAIAAIEKELAAPLATSWQRAAHGILRVTTANIVKAVRAISTERGDDPRNMLLVAFGGAGPLHAIEVARSLEMSRVLIPYYCGVFSAHGIAAVDIAYDAQRTWLKPLAQVDADDLADITGELAGQLMSRVAGDGFEGDELDTRWLVDLRYVGQSHALTVSLSSPDLQGLEASRKLFVAEHLKRYGHASDSAPVELVNLRLKISRPRASFGGQEQASAEAEIAPVGFRAIWLDENEEVECPVYRRQDLPVGWQGTGPLVIEQFDSATVIGRGDRIEVLPASRAMIVSIDFDSRKTMTTNGRKENELSTS
ncbi:hydantoinase/oxoprolinase family protein [Aquamicrobium terrae]|uniref:N-methylhydantoinase A n=1 Tax=Aquamicrobium terrae TaxID=1324945 RepID=A0ABV2N7D7_9HYPH